MKHLRAYLTGFALFLAFVAGGASAAWIPSMSGPQDLSQTWYLFNQQLGNYMSYAQTGELGSLSFSPGVCVSTTSLCVYMPNGALRYIQTSATP